MSRPKTEAADYKRLTLRLPAELLETLQAQAAASRRTMNTHTVCVLEYGTGLSDEFPIPGEKRARKPRKHRDDPD